MAEPQERKYVRHMRKAAEDHDMRQIGMAVELAEFEAQIAAVEGRHGDASRWLCRAMWADKCAESVEVIRYRGVM